MAKPNEILDKLLQQIANEQNILDYDLKVQPISSGGANYSSNLYDVTFSKDGKDIYMFAKVAATGEKMRAQSPMVFKTENFAYTKLVKVYEQLQDKFQVPKEHRLAVSKFYGCNTKSYEEAIVLENLVKSGFESYDRFKPMSKEYAYSAMTELAKFHALSFAYAEYYPEEFNEVAEEYKFEWDAEGPKADYFKTMIRRAIAISKEEFRGPLQKFFQEMPEDAILKYLNLTKRPVLGHGDYRPSNLMHKNRVDGSVEIKIVDLQTIQSKTLMVDLLYFIITGSDEEFRAQYYDKLIDHYYTQLHAAMERLHLDPEKVYSRADFEHELKEKLPLGLIIAVFTLPFVTVDAENAPKVDEDLDLIDFSKNTTSDLFIERWNGVVNDYVRWGILKN